MSEWKTIDSAPKDGSYIITLITGFLPSISYFKNYKWLTHEPEDFFCEDCWTEYINNTEYLPTHWMPLPLPPGENHD